MWSVTCPVSARRETGRWRAGRRPRAGGTDRSPGQTAWVPASRAAGQRPSDRSERPLRSTTTSCSASTPRITEMVILWLGRLRCSAACSEIIDRSFQLRHIIVRSDVFQSDQSALSRGLLNAQHIIESVREGDVTVFLTQVSER